MKLLLVDEKLTMLEELRLVETNDRIEELESSHPAFSLIGGETPDYVPTPPQDAFPGPAPPTAPAPAPAPSPPPATRTSNKNVSINFPDRIDSMNVLTAFKQQGIAIPPALEQLQRDLDFHYFEMNGLVKPLHGAKGVITFRIDASLLPHGHGQAQADDVGPHTQWVLGSKSLDVNVGLNFDSLGQLLKLVALPDLSPITGRVVFKWQWSPKVGAVLSGSAGSSLFWQLSAADGQYVDGGHTLIGVIRRRRDVKKMWLRILPGTPNQEEGTWAEYALSFFRRRARLAGEARIPITFTPSEVAPPVMP